MTLPSRLRDTATGFLGRLLCTGLLVCGLGLASDPAMAAGTSVTVDTGPLISQPSIPPNIMLMLDDSGSMSWNFMPDFNYLADTTNDGLINSGVNGVYYSPTVLYTLPPTVDGKSTFPAQTDMTKVYVDGYASSKNTVNLTNYNGNYEFKEVGGGVSSGSAISFSTSVAATSTVSVANSSACSALQNNDKTISSVKYHSSSKTCTVTYQGINVFQYSTGAVGSYTDHYVAATDCGHLTNCVLATDTTGTSAPSGTAAGTNIANWFAYYHTRILMAKSGLLTAFATINPKYRVGFGSIDNNASSKLPSGQVTYNSIKMATVQPFGDGTNSTDQRTQFWTWVTAESANNGTPLRSALDAVGQYYQQAGPWATMSTDPDPTTNANVEIACRQSYTILTTDGFWNDSISSGPGDVDGTAATINGPNSTSYTYTPAVPYKDVSSGTTYQNTLADYAMKYWVTDLRPTDNEVPKSDADPAFWQHMVTFTLGLGFQPVYSDGKTVIPMDKVFAWAQGSGSAITNFSWPQPSSGSINNISDLAHAAVNGHGGFYSATSPTAFTDGLADALQRASQRTGTGASLAANSTQLQTNTFAYQANYFTATWLGDLKAYVVNSTTGAIATSASWSASTMLPTAANRNIYTYNPTGSGTYLAFQVSSTGTLPALSTAQLSALGSSTSDQTNMINYLRGDGTNEAKNTGGIYRSRSQPLGDIVDSQPVFVGAPTANQFYGQTFTGSASYTAYASTGTGGVAGRRGEIYVAANDGYLHAFNATTGAETYAYLPGAVITSNLTYLSNPNYGLTGSAVPHEYFNDGELAVADVYMSGSWKTVLVGTTGRGLAKAVYALDITDPTNIKFLWERSAGDGGTNSNYIGQMTGKPVVAMTADDGTSGTTWSVFMGNGYNSSAGVSALLQFNLADGTLNVHATTDTTGLAAPSVWMDAPTTGVSDIAYAGDLSGNVWSFVLNTGTASATATASSPGTLLFTATDGSGTPQPITAGMLAGKDSQSNVWLFFGTGKYLTANDLSDKSVQSWYGIIVKSGVATNPSNPAISSQTNKTRSSLAPRYITAETSGSATSQAARTVTTSTAASSMTGLSGWYIDLEQPQATSPITYNAQGERIVTPNQFQGNLLLATTRIPKSTDPCNPSGTGWVMAVDPFTGTNPQSSFFDLDGNGVINASDTVNGAPAAGIGFSSLPNNPIFVGGNMLTSFDNGSNSSVYTSGSTNAVTRVTWRELINQ